MTIDRKTVSILAGLLLAAPFAHAQETVVPKQLAGPPSDFATMREPAPADSAIVSKSALVPVALRAGKAGTSNWQGRIPVESGRARFLLLNGGDRSWRVSLASPDGRRIDAAGLAKSARSTTFGLEKASHAADLYALDGLEPGVWNLSIEAPAAATRDGWLLIEGDEATELTSWSAHARQRVGEMQGVVAMLARSDADGVALGASAGRITAASLRVTAPDGTSTTHAMFDDGAHGDGAAGDGQFGGQFPAAKAGQYVAQVVAEGVDATGQAILRTSEHLVPVVEASLRIVGADASGKALGDGRIAIEIDVQAAKAAQHYRAWAEVWGTGPGGDAVPVAWVGGMVEPKAGRVALGFDERWVVRAGAAAPFTLRNLRLEHPDHSVTVASADALALGLPAVQTKARATDIVVDERMTMGPRPAGLSAKGVGSRLLLVHGYCSGGVWPAAQFSSASTFLDANQNRSHDQFARLILSFGNTWNSYGIVAHSQGGAAALHLYNYYWSGLDNAVGARLIQSVGTPYRGTNLAGILATLGSWFGVGCGTNSDLSYSGASSWLAGIPTSSRAKVHYYTTAFRSTNWWTNDYCNFATDLVLSDPEDGTTEQANGQLSGGNNRGHVTGQCHTTGMRDPAQYLDSSRNATMNANAAR
jgi:hypothetical protein